MLALPGSAYLYQGEELGLPDVTDLPDAGGRPVFRRTAQDGFRDGCRVPIPWTRAGRPTASARRQHAAAARLVGGAGRRGAESDPASTLELYRRALALRRDLTGPGNWTG